MVATNRLDVRTKERVKNEIESVLGRLKYCAEFPMPCDKSSLKELYISGIRPHILEAVRTIKEDPIESGVLTTSYYGRIRLEQGDNLLYTLTLEHYFDIPRLHSVITSQHPQYWPLLKYCNEDTQNAARASNAISYAREAIEACSSVGQIVRALPFLSEFLPDRLKEVLAQAKRKSRMPSGSGWVHCDEKNEELHNALAIACLLRTHDEHARVNKNFAYRPSVVAAPQT